MKWLFVYVLFLHTLLYSQTNENTDSIAYYSDLSFPSVPNNNYNEALLLTQKAISKAEADNNIKEQASENYNLGKIYYDLKKYDDAIESLSKSTALLLIITLVCVTWQKKILTKLPCILIKQNLFRIF